MTGEGTGGTAATTAADTATATAEVGAGATAAAGAGAGAGPRDTAGATAGDAAMRIGEEGGLAAVTIAIMMMMIVTTGIDIGAGIATGTKEEGGTKKEEVKEFILFFF